MGELTVTGLDEAVLARLGSQAVTHGRSVDEEAAAILAAEVAAASVIKPSNTDEW